MSAKKQQYAFGPQESQIARAVKRSISVSPNIDTALREIVAGGDGNYSQIANDAFTLYLQARGIEAIERDVTATSGPITRSARLEVDRRLEDARRRAALRRKRND